MVVQYFIVAAIVIVVIAWQFASYRANEERIDRIKHLFPEQNNSIVVKTNDTTTIYNEEASGEFKETLEDINSYLAKNKNKTFDYHILKEIVERNSQSLEDEVDTMLSTPLYLGLIATIFGIAFGVVVFAWKDLANLLAGANMNPEGIKILLTDVGIAMAASLCGVFFTKQSTTHYNEAKTSMTKNKNRFLTWIQTDLMSKLSDDITGALIRMTQDLNEFNSSFAQNTKELKETLKTVNDNYEGQVKLLDAIDRIKINKIAKANIEVYDRLQGCTEELENLFTILSDSETYVTKVTELNSKLGSIEERTLLFEELGNYFKNEVEYVKDRQGMMRQQMSGLDSVLQDALSNMGDSLTLSLQNLTSVFQTQNQRIQQLIDEQQQALADSLRTQQDAINEKIGQIDNPFEGVKEAFAEGLNSIKETFELQNVTIQEMLSKQNCAFEEALRAQQEIVLKKLQNAPNQLQALTDISRAVERLNQNIIKLENSHQGQISRIAEIQVSSDNDEQPKKKSFCAKCKALFVPICAFGSFLVLLCILLLQLFGS
jgi:hypothetical protein